MVFKVIAGAARDFKERHLAVELDVKERDQVLDFTRIVLICVQPVIVRSAL